MRMEGTELIKVGVVETVSGSKAKVRFVGKRTTSMELVILDNTWHETEEQGGGSGYAEFDTHRHDIKRWVPEVGDHVLCILLPNGHGQGYILGSVED
jgi:hypothetical protein